MPLSRPRTLRCCPIWEPPAICCSLNISEYKVNWTPSFLIALTTFQMFHSHTWSVATMVDSKEHSITSESIPLEPTAASPSLPPCIYNMQLAARGIRACSNTGLDPREPNLNSLTWNVNPITSHLLIDLCSLDYSAPTHFQAVSATRLGLNQQTPILTSQTQVQPRVCLPQLTESYL